MRRVFVITAMLAVTAFAQEDECILDAVTPLLERADSVKRTGKNEITEARKEKSVAYTVTQGGCAHYGVTFSFADWAPRKDESLLQEAARLMRGVKLKKDKQYLVEGIVRLLEANAKSKYTSGDTLPNPDHSDINVSVEGDKIGGYKRIVKVIYSQVL